MYNNICVIYNKDVVIGKEIYVYGKKIKMIV